MAPPAPADRRDGNRPRTGSVNVALAGIVIAAGLLAWGCAAGPEKAGPLPSPPAGMAPAAEPAPTRLPIAIPPPAALPAAPAVQSPAAKEAPPDQVEGEKPEEAYREPEVFQEEPAAEAAPSEEGSPGWRDDAYDRTIILALGDSVTWGRGSASGGPPTDYLSRLLSRLNGPWIGRNRGTPQAKAINVRYLADRYLARNRPGLTILMVGLNDAVFNVPPAGTLAEIEALAGDILARGGGFIICTTTPVLPEKRPAQYHRLASLNKQILELAARKGWAFVDIWKLFHEQPDWRSLIEPISANHPNDQGHDLIADALRARIAGGNLLAGRVDWVAVEPLKAGRATREDNLPAARPLAADASSPLADGRLAAATPLDVDGNGRDELAAVTIEGGRQVFGLFTAPAAGAGLDGKPAPAPRALVRDEWAYPAGAWITHLFRFDLEGDGRDEVGLVRWDPVDRVQSLEIWTAHQPGVRSAGEAAAARRLVVDEGWITMDGRVRDAAPLRGDADAADELAVLVERAPGVQEILIFDTPTPDGMTEEGRPAILLEAAVPPGGRVLGLAGQDIDGDGLDELILLRLGEIGRYDVLEGYDLPTLPREEAGGSLTLLAADRWARILGAHQRSLAPMRLWDERAGAIVPALAIWRNR